jgi:uncharacterized low-complexity protein
MNVKALAAIVGTLSLGALVTGCASTKAAEGSSTEAKGAESSCQGEGAEKAGEAACKTEAKGAEGACGEGGCSAKK